VKKPFLAGFSLLLLVSPLYPQQPVNLRNTHERVVCIVPMVGRGTPDDPRRPMFAPLPPGPNQERTRDGIIAFTYQESDDGRYALVEFVALDRSAFQPILAESRPDVQVFVKGKAKRADIEAEFRKLKRNFDIERFRVNVP
jgi:hypothetical protein